MICMVTPSGFRIWTVISIKDKYVQVSSDIAKNQFLVLDKYRTVHLNRKTKFANSLLDACFFYYNIDTKPSFS